MFASVPSLQRMNQNGDDDSTLICKALLHHLPCLVTAINQPLTWIQWKSTFNLMYKISSTKSGVPTVSEFQSHGLLQVFEWACTVRFQTSTHIICYIRMAQFVPRLATGCIFWNIIRMRFRVPHFSRRMIRACWWVNTETQVVFIVPLRP